jgi:methylase of polypeptide subunit release factors
MSQRDSGYERKERDLYETPAWVTEALLPHLPQMQLAVLEPACGSGTMVAALERAGHSVLGQDIAVGNDFLTAREKSWPGLDAVITNPPYELAREFIETALGMAEEPIVAMLLRTDFDHAKTRQHFFSDCPQFAKKLVLTKRIRWFEDSKGSPSFNHAWFIWDHAHQGPPTLAYGP